MERLGDTDPGAAELHPTGSPEFLRGVPQA